MQIGSLLTGTSQHQGNRYSPPVQFVNRGISWKQRLESMRLLHRFNGVPTADTDLLSISEGVMSTLVSTDFGYQVPTLSVPPDSNRIARLPFTVLQPNVRIRNDQNYLQVAQFNNDSDLLLKNIYENPEFNLLAGSSRTKEKAARLRNLVFAEIGGEIYFYIFLGELSSFPLCFGHSSAIVQRSNSRHGSTSLHSPRRRSSPTCLSASTTTSPMIIPMVNSTYSPHPPTHTYWTTSTIENPRVPRLPTCQS